MLKKLIATGKVVDSKKVKLVASVYVDVDANGDEADEIGGHYVSLALTHKDADALPGDAMTYQDIISAAEGGEESGASSSEGLVVPGVGGHADVDLATPYLVKYSKTKAFTTADGTIKVFAKMRYTF